MSMNVTGSRKQLLAAFMRLCKRANPFPEHLQTVSGVNNLPTKSTRCLTDNATRFYSLRHQFNGTEFGDSMTWHCKRRCSEENAIDGVVEHRKEIGGVQRLCWAQVSIMLCRLDYSILGARSGYLNGLSLRFRRSHGDFHAALPCLERPAQHRQDRTAVRFCSSLPSHSIQ